MSDQLLDWDEAEHERTGGPAYCTGGCCAAPDSFCNVEADNTPLQEQVEQQDAHIFQLEDALSKSVDVIAALMGERKDLHDQVYQAQVDAQDWQNQFNGCQRELATLRDERDTWKVKAKDEAIIADSRISIIQDLTDQIKTYERRLTCYPGSPENDNLLGDYENLRARVFQLTHENTQLELRNERQYKMIEVAKYALIGSDINGNSIT